MSFATCIHCRLKLADYFWCLVFLLGVTVILVCTVVVRTFVIGVQSSRLYLYTLLLLFIFCIMCLIAWIQVGEKRSSDLILLVFYFIFSVVFSLCLMSVAEPLLGIRLLSSYEAFENHVNSLLQSVNVPLTVHISHSLLAVLLSLVLAVLPPLMVSSAFRFSQLQLQRRWYSLPASVTCRSIVSFLATHLPLIIIVMSCLPFLNTVEGKIVGSVVITSDLWWTVRATLFFLWIVCRILCFRPLLQQYLNEGAGKRIRDAISASMIDAIHENRYHPGSEMGKVKFPNAMYYVPNWIFAVAIQLCVPVVVVGCVFTLSMCLGERGEYAWVATELQRVGLPLHALRAKPSAIQSGCAEIVKKAFPALDLASLRVMTPELLSDLSSFVFVFVLSTYYFLQCMGHLYWKNQSYCCVCSILF